MTVTYHATLLEAVRQYVGYDEMAAQFLAGATRCQAEVCVRLLAPTGLARMLVANDMNTQETLTAALYGWRPVGLELRLRENGERVECAKLTLFDRGTDIGGGEGAT